MEIIGITGTSGSGKTIVCNILANKYKAFIIDCDKIAKQMLIKESEYFELIVKTFGTGILKTNGEVDRKKLANIVYNNKKECKKLNKLTNTYVLPEIIKRIEGKKNKGSLIIIDAPLLIESKLNELCDITIAILANEEIKVERICKRDKVDKNIAKLRLNIQQTDMFYIQKSDYVINNNGNDIAKLQEEIDYILKIGDKNV